MVEQDRRSRPGLGMTEKSPQMDGNISRRIFGSNSAYRYAKTQILLRIGDVSCTSDGGEGGACDLYMTELISEDFTSFWHLRCRASYLNIHEATE